MKRTPRKSLKDIWNAFMCRNAIFTDGDIPLCPTTARTLPIAIITWDEAKRMYKRAMAKKEFDFHSNAFVCWYMDDWKFDGPSGIWHNYKFVLKVLRHFAGAITPDFSTYQDFPEPIKLYNTYRMRVFGYWLGLCGIPVINNVRWGTLESHRYCFNGIPKDSIVAIGTVGGNPRRLLDRKRFEAGLRVMVERLHPRAVVFYGSANYPCCEELKERGITVISFPSSTAKAFATRRQHV